MRTKSTRITILLLLGVGIAFFLLPSCEKIKEATNIKFKYDLPDVTTSIDSSSLLKTELVLFSSPFTVNIDSIIGTNTGYLKYISFYKLRFTINAPNLENLDWLSSARATLMSEGSSPIELAPSATINSKERTVDFLLNDVDISSAIRKPFVLSIYGNINGPIPVASVQILVQSGLQITVNPF